MNRLIWSIWIINALLQWGISVQLLRKDNWRRHPAFATFIAFNSCRTSILIWVRIFERPLYDSVNWGSWPVNLFLLIAVVVEVFSAVFRPYSTLPKGTVYWFKFAFAALILLTVAVALFFPGSTPGNWMNTIMVLNRSAAIIFCGAFAFTALFSTYFGIPWQHRTYGIGVGFLLYMSVDISAASMSAMYGYKMGMMINVASMLGYTLALITWIIYFAMPDIPSRTPSLEQLKRLQKALDYTTSKADSYREWL